MNSGLRDANNLAWKLAAVTSGKLGPGLLASYEPERRGHAWAMIEFALNIGRVLAPPNALAAWAIETMFRALSFFPKTRDYIAQMKFKPPPRFSDGFLVPDGVGNRHTLVGRLYPQPRVRTADGREVLLDEVLGDGFSIVVRSPRADDAMAALRGEPWSKLGARIIVMNRDAAELGAASPRLARFNDHVILLRPDRYVAACIAVDELQRGAAKVGKLIASTTSFRDAPEARTRNL